MADRCVNVVEMQGVDPKAVEFRTYGDWVCEAHGWGVRFRGGAGGAIIFYRNKFGETYWIRYFATCRRFVSGIINPLMTLEELTEKIGELYGAVIACDWGKQLLMDIADLLPPKFRD